jgi:uncharacterized protein (TIGR03118 family)
VLANRARSFAVLKLTISEGRFVVRNWRSNHVAIRLLCLLGTATAIAAVAGSADATRSAAGYTVRNLVSDGFVPAEHTDPHLVNAWGIAAGPSTPWWVADNGTDVSTLYDGNGVAVPLVVSTEGGPTGAVFNGGSDFVVNDGAGHSGPALFMFASENGAIHGWNPAVPPSSTHAFVVVNRTNDSAVFKGLAIAGSRLYATDFHNSHVDVFDGSFHQIVTPGAFTDPALPAGFAPFGIQNLGGTIFVTYAKQMPDRMDEVDGPGLGYVDAYDQGGHLLGRVASAGDLNAPWGLSMAPAGFGKFAGDLLVGNFGDGHIHAFKQGTSGHFTPAGQLTDTSGRAIVIDGLWGIGFGNGSKSGPTTTLYFAAGPDDEAHGLFGRIDPSS